MPVRAWAEFHPKVHWTMEVLTRKGCTEGSPRSVIQDPDALPGDIEEEVTAVKPWDEARDKTR